MKKLLTVIFAALIAVVSLAGCNNEKWIEVQSITYSFEAKYTTLVSGYSWELGEDEQIEADEYISATKNQERLSTSGNFEINRSSFIKNLSQNKGKYIYHNNRYDPSVGESIYCKKKLLYYNCYYVKVRLLEDGNIELNYYEYQNSSYKNKTTRIKPTSYEITYFND